jgi:hypothetical protein
MDLPRKADRPAYHEPRLITRATVADATGVRGGSLVL